MKSKTRDEMKEKTEKTIFLFGFLFVIIFIIGQLLAVLIGYDRPDKDFYIMLIIDFIIVPVFVYDFNRRLGYNDVFIRTVAAIIATITYIVIFMFAARNRIEKIIEINNILTTAKFMFFYLYAPNMFLGVMIFEFILNIKKLFIKK